MTLLDIDDTATAAINELTTVAGVAQRGGLRIALVPEADGQRFALSIAPHPARDDQVVSREGARVFLEARAAEALSNKVLDVRRQHAGRFHFGVYPGL